MQNCTFACAYEGIICCLLQHNYIRVYEKHTMHVINVGTSKRTN